MTSSYAKGNVMPHNWTLKRLQDLSIKELETLERNVRAKGEADLGDQCFEVRLSKLSPAARKKALGIFTFEQTIARDLGNFARELDKEFDLSKETATKLGTPHPHALTDNRGDAKTGGAMKSGRFALDRYISYRLKDSKLTVAVILHLNRTIDQAVYAVVGTSDVLPLGKYRDDLELIKGEVAAIFPSLATAKAEYRKLLATFAPARAV
jgi:hypothetical protein